MALTIVTLCFVSDPTLRYANGITSVEKINIDVDELHIMLFHKIALRLGVENVETFGCRVNKKGTFYMLNTDSAILNFLNNLKGANFVDVYVVHPISIPLFVDEILVLPNTNLKSSPPLVEEQTPAPRVEEHSNSNSLYDIDKNIDDLKQVKEKTDRVNLDEISSGPVGIDAGFKDIYKERRGRFEGNLNGDDLYFDSSDPGSDISEDEGDHVENDEVVDSAPRKESTKIYFDPTAKKGGTAKLLYSKGVNIKLKPNDKEMIRAKCNKKGCPWHILGSIDGNTGNFSVDGKKGLEGIGLDGAFLKSCIKHDLELTKGEGLTVMSDMQKGLHLALIDVLSNAEIRWYARQNGQTGRNTGGVKKGEENSGRLPGHHLSELGVGIVEALLRHNKEAWCRAYYKEHSKCDVEIRVKIMEIMNQMREFLEKWITDVSPMAMRKNAEITDNCEVKFNGDFGFEIHDPPYKHVVDLKKKVYSTYDNHEDVAKSDRPTIEPLEITAMPGRPGKNRKRDSEEPVKKKFGKATRKGRKIKCSVCKTFGHNKKGCLTLKIATAGTSVATAKSQSSINAGPSAGCTPSASLISARRPTNASSSGVRPATALASGGRPTSATSSDVRQLSTQQSTFSAAGQKRKTSTTLRSGATLAYKKPTPKKAKTAGYGLLFGSSGSVTERSENTNRVLHSATLSSSTPTNIVLGYKPNGLRWKGRVAITQRQLWEESYRSTNDTQDTPSTQGTH
ncbi:hypothetical protein H5410_011678 [Solanum commersonii]|uniref:Transposase MuDR plant domain-containing protein n=1 Tax=Solanum commersonii TaxID=4109 RepID=A0A9J6AQ28_SOLCO|nr:hypothetical protein H5410_011678 [Solanum commersonii]